MEGCTNREPDLKRKKDEVGSKYVKNQKRAGKAEMRREVGLVAYLSTESTAPVARSNQIKNKHPKCFKM